MRHNTVVINKSMFTVCLYIIFRYSMLMIVSVLLSYSNHMETCKYVKMYVCMCTSLVNCLSIDLCMRIGMMSAVESCEKYVSKLNTNSTHWYYN